MSPSVRFSLHGAHFIPPKELGNAGACAVAVRKGLVDPNIWVPEENMAESVREAAAWCRECPVQAECLAYARESDGIQGVYGGYTFGLRVGRRPPALTAVGVDAA